MPLKKIKKGLEQSLTKEKQRCPSTLIGGIFHNLKIRRLESRIKDIETELSNRKTKR